jgi:hypothetical protein
MIGHTSFRAGAAALSSICSKQHARVASTFSMMRSTTTTTTRSTCGMTGSSFVSSLYSKNTERTSFRPRTSPMLYHASAKREQADATTAITSAAAVPSSTVSVSTSSWMNRWIVTAEVAVSKIFPGGFGWQTGSLVAANYYSYASDSLDFALCTGIGDAVGVFGGHCLYYGVKQSMVPSSKIDMVKEMHTGLWLACAAFCSGTVWQPIVTTLQSANCSFNEVMIGTWLTCSAAFFIGLRAGRTILPLSTLASPSYDNSQTDIALSISIGGATGFFVGTDTAYLPEQNFLLPWVGITETTTDLVGCSLAGTSTALGFVTSQSVLNTIYPPQKCWND